MKRSLAGWRVPGIVLIVAVALGFVLRLTPCLRHPDFDYILDGQYHRRLVAQVVDAGRLAELDSLSNAPGGRRTADHLPEGLYFAGAPFHRLLAAAGSSDLRWNLAWFLALAGALIALPVWLGALAVFRDRRAAAAAAILAVFLPAHVNRTLGIALRYDGLGTLLVTTHAALVLATLSEPPSRRRWLYALGAALAFVAAMSVWRVSLLVVELELAFAAVRFAARGPDAAMRALWLAVAIVGTLGLLPIRYLAAHGFLRSPIWLAVAGFALALALPGLERRGRWPLRVLLLAAVGAAALIWGRLESAADYAGLASMLETKLGWARGHDPDASLMLTVLELQGMSLARFLAGPHAFSLLGAVFVLSPALFWQLAGRPGVRALLAMDAAPAMLAFVAGALAVSTLLFQRSCVLLAPLLAIIIGGLLMRSWTSLRTPARPDPAHRGPARRPARGLERLGFAAVAIGVAAAIAGGVFTAATSVARLAPNERTAIEFLRRHAPRDAIVMCDWDAGYEIQSRAGRATVVDGLLESAENRRRIVALYQALMDPGPARLEALCRSHHASWLLLPTSSAIYAMAEVTGDPLADVLARHDAVPRGPLTNHLIVHLIEGEPSYPALRRAFEAGGYTVFEIARP